MSAGESAGIRLTENGTDVIRRDNRDAVCFPLSRIHNLLPQHEHAQQFAAKKQNAKRTITSSVRSFQVNAAPPELLSLMKSVREEKSHQNSGKEMRTAVRGKSLSPVIRSSSQSQPLSSFLVPLAAGTPFPFV